MHSRNWATVNGSISGLLNMLLNIASVSVCTPPYQPGFRAVDPASDLRQRQDAYRQERQERVHEYACHEYHGRRGSEPFPGHDGRRCDLHDGDDCSDHERQDDLRHEVSLVHRVDQTEHARGRGRHHRDESCDRHDGARGPGVPRCDRGRRSWIGSFQASLPLTVSQNVALYHP